MKNILRLFSLIKIKSYGLYNSFGIKNVECPICKWQGREFLPFGVKTRQNALCPRCHSLERHRLLFLYFKTTIKTNEKIKLLHFAPEKSLENLFKTYKNIEYLSVDLMPGYAMKVEDITKLTFKDKLFDIICCSHILEHIPDDVRAMKELKRVLKPSGYAIIQVPIDDRDKTFEDSTVTSEHDRERIFGQKDHVRIYGRDYTERLKKVGFKVDVIDFTKEIGQLLTKKYALLPNNGLCAPTEKIIYKCS